MPGAVADELARRKPLQRAAQQGADAGHPPPHADYADRQGQGSRARGGQAGPGHRIAVQNHPGPRRDQPGQKKDRQNAGGDGAAGPLPTPATPSVRRPAGALSAKEEVVSSTGTPGQPFAARKGPGTVLSSAPRVLSA